MKAVVVAVGSELMLPGRPDTNAEWLIGRLLDLGFAASWRLAVEDDTATIAAQIRLACATAAVVVVTGGLGPTEDDRTRVALAEALGLPLERDPSMVSRIEARFSARGRIAGPEQARQADRPAGTEWIDNPVGSAPGVLAVTGGGLLAALPGVPAEMRAMFAASVAPRVAGLGRAAIARRVLRVAGRTESYVDRTVRDLYASEGTETTILTSSGTVELVLTARGATRDLANARLDDLEAAMRSRLGADVYGAGDDTLASVVGHLLRSRSATVAVAESCTGGLVGAAFTEVPGSSAWFRGGLICYANDLKTSLAGVPDEVIRLHGAVSEPVARALAAGAREACRADIGIGVTGVAGPEGGTADKPVGTVHLAVSDSGTGAAARLDAPGDRELVRRRAVSLALDLLRRRLLAP